MLVSALLLSAAHMTASPPVVMKLLLVAWDSNDITYQAITKNLAQVGVPYQAVFLNNITPDGSGSRLSGIPLTDSANGRGLYQAIIETDSSFTTCTPTCTSLLSAADVSKLNAYAVQYSVRMVCYYGWPEPAWGLQPGDFGASYTATSPLNVTLSAAGAAVFPYLNPAASIPVNGQGGGGIWAYKALPAAAANETTTPVLMAGTNTVGVTHTTADGRETMALTMDNYPGLLHSTVLNYGIINWATKGVFLGSRRVYLNPEIDDLLLGIRLYKPSQPACPDDPSCPTLFATGNDLQAMADWQANLQSTPQFRDFYTTYAYNGVGTTWFPPSDPIFAKMAALNSRFTFVSHTWDHANLDCYSKDSGGVCIPATLAQSEAELNQNIAVAGPLGITLNRTDMVTPFNGGLTNPAFLQAAVEAGLRYIVTADDPAGTQIGLVNPIQPSIFQMTRRVPDLFSDVSSPLTGVDGSWPDEYNAKYGPGGEIPTYTQNQTYSQIIDIESDKLLKGSLITYEPYPLAFHVGNSSLYDGTHSMFFDLMDATISKYKNLFSLPVVTLDLNAIGPLLMNRASFDNSGVVGIFTPGVSVVLTTTNAATIPVTGACAQAVCSTYAGQIQDAVLVAANSTVTLSLTAADGVVPASVTLTPISVPGGASATASVVLSSAAPSGGVSVALSSNNAAATVPATVTVPAGRTSVNFTVTTTTITSSTTATIKATYSGASKSAPLTITAAAGLSSVSVNPTSVTGGAPSTGTVTLSSAAPAGGTSVTLSSNNAAAAVPANVIVPAGGTTATFTAATTAVASAITATITATYNSISKTAALTVTPLAVLSSVSVSPTSVTGGTSSTGTVTLSSAAPSGGISVALSSNNAAAAVPANVIVAAGGTTATFTTITTAVASAITATITATYNSVSKTAALTVAPPAPALSSVSVNPTSVAGGTSSTGTVTLGSAAPSGGISVALSKNNAAATVPASVLVPAGSSSANFTVTTTAVAASTAVTITATYSSVSKTAALTITPPAPALSSLSVNPTSVAGGTSSTGTVTLSSAAPTGGIAVALSKNNAAATVPASVLVPAGSSSANFTVTTTAVAASTAVTITATYSSVSKTAALTITPPAPALSSVSVNPTSVTGGTSSTGTVTLSSAAPSGGISVALSKNNAAATVPASVIVPAGSATATFTVTTIAVASSTAVTITATYKSVNKTAALTIAPSATLSSVSLAPTTVAGGTSSTGTLTLSAAAATGGLVVSLSTNNSLVTSVPASITIPAGSKTGTFTVKTTSFLITWSVTITAKLGSTSKTAILTVTR